MVVEGIMARLGGLPLPEAVAMTPPRGGAGHNVAQQWVANNSGPPAQHPAGAPPQGRAGATSNSHSSCCKAGSVATCDRGRSSEGRAMEAAMEAMVSTGGEALLQLLNNSGHQGVVSMLSMEGPEPSTQK